MRRLIIVFRTLTLLAFLSVSGCGESEHQQAFVVPTANAVEEEQPSAAKRTATTSSPKDVPPKEPASPRTEVKVRDEPVALDFKLGDRVVLKEGAKLAKDGEIFSDFPDGQTLTVSRVEGDRIWSQFVAPISLKGHKGANRCLFSPDGKRLATWTRSTTKEGPSDVEIWDATTSRRLHVLEHPNSVTYAAFSPDGTRIAAGSVVSQGASHVRVWNVKTGDELLTLKFQAWGCYMTRFSPDGRLLASAGVGRTMVWDASTGQELFILKHRVGYGATVFSVSFSPDSKRIVTAGANAEVMVWDALTGKELLALPHPARLARANFSPDGKWLATGTINGLLMLWDADKGQPLLSVREFAGSVHVHFSPDGKRLLARGGNGTAKVWDLESRRELMDLRLLDKGTPIVYSPKGDLIASSQHLGKIQIWDALDAELLIEFHAHNGPIEALAFSPDGKRLASCSRDTKAIVWNVGDGKGSQVWVSHKGVVKAPSLDRLPPLPDVKLEPPHKRDAPPRTVIPPKDAPPPAVAPFDAQQANAHQERWAGYLASPVERQIDLPEGVKLTLVLIPPGEFLMGSPEAEQRRVLNDAIAMKDPHARFRVSTECPQHRVLITQPYLLGKDEVTQAQWRAVMGNNPSKSNQPDNPVVRVSWEDIQTFLLKLNQNHEKQGLKFRLPTEAQWEYACRAGSTTAYCFGESERMLSEFGWWWSGGRYGFKTHRVGQLKPNPWGLRDMHGNVWEWCADWFGKSYYAQSPTNDPKGPSTGAERVFRGGCYLYHPALCRSAYRGNKSPGSRGGHIGFRVAAVMLSAELANAHDPESQSPAIPKIPPEQVEVVANTATVKIRDEVIASISKGEKFAVVRRDGSWVAINVGKGSEERIGWVWARQVQTVVPPEITEESTAPGSSRLLRVSIDWTQLVRQSYTNTSTYLLYCRVSIDNRDVNAAPYDATEFEVKIDGQAVKHDVSNRQRFEGYVRYRDKDSPQIRKAAELEYLQAGQVPAGGSVDGWLRFKLPAFKQASELAKKTWTLTGKLGDRSFSVDLRQAEFDALAARVRPAAVDDSVSVVEIGGSRLNGLNVARLLELVKPLIAEGQGFVVVITDENCIADYLVWREIESATSRSPDMVAWANIPSRLQDNMRGYVRSPHAFFASETEAVIRIIGERQGGEARLAVHLNNAESATRVAAARALAEHTVEAGVVEALVKAASSEDAQIRIAALSSLAKSTDPKASQAVIKGMGDSETSVRVAAAQAAASHEAQSVVDPLVGLLEDSDTNVLVAACASLGTLKCQKAVPRIKELQASEDQRISVAATDALKAIGTLSSLEAARVKLGTARLATDELDALAEAKDKTVVPKLIAELQSKHKADQSYANQLVKVLGDIGDSRAVEPLLGLLRDSPGTHGELPLALGRLGDKRAIGPLEVALNSGRVPQRCSFYGALLMLEVPGILERFSADVGKNLHNHAPDDVKRLLDILTRRRDPQTIPLIEPLLDSYQHHRSAALALIEMGTPAAIEAIRRQLVAPDRAYARTVISQVAEALKQANQQAFTAQAATSPQLEDQLQRAVSLVTLVRDAKNSPSSSVRSNASRYFNETAASIRRSLAEPGVVEALVKAASDEDTGTRSAAVYSLAYSQAPQATEAIIRALSDDNARVRSAAATAAGSHQGETIVDLLVKLLRDPDVDVVIGACDSLGRLKADKAVEGIKELQSAEDTRVAAAAIDALKAIGTVTNLEAARAKLGRVRLSIDELDALSEARDKSVVPKLIAETQSSQKTDRSYTDQLIKVLGDIGDPQAVEPLLDLLNQRSDPPPGSSPHLALCGAELPTALGKLGDKRAIEPLEEALAKASSRQSGASSSAIRTQRHSILAALLRLEAPGIADRVSEELKRTSGYELSPLLVTLGRSGGPQAVPLIEPLLDNPQHCQFAASALAQVGSPEAMEPIRSRLMSNDYPHAQAVASQLGREPYPRPSQQDTFERVQTRLDQTLALVRTLADSPNQVVRDNVPNSLFQLGQRFAANDLRAFMAHISAEEFDAADEAFRESIEKSVKAVDTDPFRAGHLKHCVNIMWTRYSRVEQPERTEKHFAWIISEIEDIAGKPNAPDLSGLLLDLRALRVISALSAETDVDETAIRQLLNECESHFDNQEADGPTASGFTTAVTLATALRHAERIELAVETYELLARTAGRSKHESVTRMATGFAGAARQLSLLGNEISIKGTTLDGKPFDWEPYREKVVLINFWTSTHNHCRSEIANARKAYELYRDRGFDVVGINLDEDADKMKAYLKKEKMPWTILHTEAAGWKHPMAVEYGIHSVPKMFLVDREGKVVSIEAGRGILDKLLNELIGPPEPSK